MEWLDIDGDGEEEMITGKRFRAHNGGAPGANDPYGIYYFKWNGASFIIYGPIGEGKGAGLLFRCRPTQYRPKRCYCGRQRRALCVFNEGQQ